MKITGVAPSGVPWAGLFARYTDENNTYYVTLRHGENQLSLRKVVDGIITELASTAFAVGMNTTYKVRLEAIGPNLKVYVDGTLLLQAMDTTFAAGRVGVGNYKAFKPGSSRSRSSLRTTGSGSPRVTPMPTITTTSRPGARQTSFI